MVSRLPFRAGGAHDLHDPPQGFTRPTCVVRDVIGSSLVDMPERSGASATGGFLGYPRSVRASVLCGIRVRAVRPFAVTYTVFRGTCLPYLVEEYVTRTGIHIYIAICANYA